MLYLTLFVISFLSATLLPLGSEALLLYDISLGEGVVGLLLVATLGNSLGSLLNYYIGSKGERYLLKSKRIQAEHLEKYKQYFHKYGGWVLCFAWLPVIGDPLTLIAGILRYNLFHFMLIVTLSKGLRYIFLSQIMQ